MISSSQSISRFFVSALIKILTKLRIFFENRDGFNFRSIEGLVSRTRENADSADAKTYGEEIHGPYIHQGKGAIGNVYKAEENFKINHVHVNRGTDIRKALAVGQYANTTVFFDSL